ncbi:probable replication protein A 14 kDa subunit B [Coccomyxa sp. Obi]|nr:probable replication protein A 14 kDa subunit B [Coccomyxa sp. Obi]
MERYIGKNVLLVCKVESVEGNRASVVAADGGRVVVSLKQTAVDTQFVEFEGTVEAPNQLRETDRAYFGGNFDMSTYNDLCRLANTDFASLFV